MYCATRSSITSQPASTTTTVVNAVSRTNQHRKAVDAQVVVDVEAVDPRGLLDELQSPPSAASKPSTAAA